MGLRVYTVVQNKNEKGAHTSQGEIAYREISATYELHLDRHQSEAREIDGVDSIQESPANMKSCGHDKDQHTVQLIIVTYHLSPVSPRTLHSQ